MSSADSDSEGEALGEAGTLLRALGAAPPRTFLGAGARIGRFLLGRRLGEGGFGVVFEATDTESGTSVALKVLRDDRPGWLLRFKREFRALADAIDPHLVRLYELGTQEGRWFFTMELLDGCALDEAIDRQPHRAAALLGGLARGIAALHARGLVHRDVKPANARVTSSGRVVLLDFGLALEVNETSGRSSAAAGTPRYMAPEQIEGHHAGPATDWYAYGVVLHEVLTGRAPFEGEGVTGWTRKVQDDVPPIEAPGQHRGLVELCRRLLSRDPAARPRGPEVLEILEAAGDEGGAAPSGAPPPRDELVGRQAELAALEEALAASRSAGPIRVAISGASGVGKSALVRAFIERACKREPSLVALLGRCYAHETLPFRALDGAVDQLALWWSRAPASRRRDALPREAHLLGELFPVLGELSSKREAKIRDPAHRRRAATAALGDLIASLAEGGPLVLALDDVHWGDAESAELLAQLLAPPRSPPVLIITTARPTEVASGFVEKWIAERTIELSPLSAEDAAALAERHMERRNLPAPHAGRIAAASEGSPFLIAMLSSAARPEDRTAPPLTVALARRLDALAPDARRLLEFLCVANRATPVGALLSAAALPTEHDAPRVLADERLARFSRVEGGWWLEPYHDRIAEALVPMLNPTRRRSIHLALAQALGRAPERAAVHLAAAGERRRAMEALGAAAEAARARMAHEHAAALYARIIELGADDHASTAELDKVRLARATALHDAGWNAAAARAFAEVARRLAPAEARAVRRSAARAWMLAGDHQAAIAMLGEADPSLGAVTRRSMARVAFGLSLTPIYERRVRGTWERGGVPDADSSDLDLLADAMLGAAYNDVRIAAACGVELLARATKRRAPAHIASSLSLTAVLFGVLRGEVAADAARRRVALARSVAAAAPIALPPMVPLSEGLLDFTLGRSRDCATRLSALAADERLDAQSGRLVRLFADLTRFVSFFYLGHARRLAAELPHTTGEFTAREHRIGRVGVTGIGSWIEALRGSPAAWESIERGRDESIAAGATINAQWSSLMRLSCALIADDLDQARLAAKEVRGGEAVSVGIGAGIEGRSFAARHGLYMALREPARRSAHLAAVRSAARWLHGRYGSTARGLGAAYLAAAAATEGDGRAFTEWSTEALPALAEAGQEGAWMALRHLRVKLGVGAEEAERRALDEWAAEHVVGDRTAMLAAYLPTLRGG